MPSFKRPVEEKIIKHNEGYLIYEFKKLSEMYKWQKRIPIAEASIKRLYYFMLKNTKRLFKLMNKMNWGAKKAKKWIIKKWIKLYGEKSAVTIKERFDKAGQLSDEEFKEKFKINDEKEIRELLKKDLLICEYIGEVENVR